VIYKKSPDEIAIMRRGARIVTETFDRLEDALRPGITTGQLDAIAEETIAKAGARASAKGYRGFPGSICTSPNDVIVHGIPGPVVLEDGDIVTLDVAVLYEGFHVDSAVTFPVGDVADETSDLLKVTQEALEAAIGQCRPGNRLGDVGHAVEQTAKAAGFSVVREYVGHGVGRSFHEDPHVPNYGPPGRREMLGAGMTLAIEPMINAGKAGTKTLDDGWTVVTIDGSMSAHFEHTVAVTLDGCEVLTRRAPR
jgi:methionyl aminopeptidase